MNYNEKTKEVFEYLIKKEQGFLFRTDRIEYKLDGETILIKAGPITRDSWHTSKTECRINVESRLGWRRYDQIKRSIIVQLESTIPEDKLAKIYEKFKEVKEWTELEIKNRQAREEEQARIKEELKQKFPELESDTYFGHERMSGKFGKIELSLKKTFSTYTLTVYDLSEEQVKAILKALKTTV